MFINPINQNFTSSRIKVMNYPAKVKKSIKSLPEIQMMAEKKDVYFKFSPTKNNLEKTNMVILKRGIDHIADIPEYALTHDTGDQVYINWEKVLYEGEVSANKNSIIDKAKQILGFGD